MLARDDPATRDSLTSCVYCSRKQSVLLGAGNMHVRKRGWGHLYEHRWPTCYCALKRRRCVAATCRCVSPLRVAVLSPRITTARHPCAIPLRATATRYRRAPLPCAAHVFRFCAPLSGDSSSSGASIFRTRQLKQNTLFPRAIDA